MTLKIRRFYDARFMTGTWGSPSHKHFVFMSFWRIYSALCAVQRLPMISCRWRRVMWKKNRVQHRVYWQFNCHEFFFRWKRGKKHLPSIVIDEYKLRKWWSSNDASIPSRAAIKLMNICRGGIISESRPEIQLIKLVKSRRTFRN